ncbi:alpha/beta hydrolase-fold protein [Georgenia alba]|uniref:Alpha/beta hydrolase-fold protein n=1 Tax=Georgenia alba TaxID=2233858 RepID=A0ABW2QAH7_9MICO
MDLGSPQPHVSRRPLRALALLGALALSTSAWGATAVGTGEPAAAGSPADGGGGGVAGLPDGVPPAALAAEPALPEPDGWPFSEDFPRTSGTHRLDDGALLWSDWLYDDTGAGRYSYEDPDAVANGADIFRAGIGLAGSRSYWRVDWNSLVDPDLPIAAWALDVDDDAGTGTAEWPADARVSSPGVDRTLVVSSRGAWLIGADGSRTDLLDAGAELVVDVEARSFVLSVPRTALRVNGEWRVRLAAGVANEAGTGFAAPPEAAGGTRVYNAAFRDREDEPYLVGGFGGMETRWNNGAQSAALTEGTVADFALDVDWRALARGATTPQPRPTGFSTRWYVSSVDLGQGLEPDVREPQGMPPDNRPRVYGRVQPYAIYVPTGYDRRSPAPLTILLHGGGGNHNSYAGTGAGELYGPMCEDRGSICITPLGRGDGTWFINEAELDVWEVWNRVAVTYSLDPERTVVAGHSMGGVATTRFAATHPDLFAAAGIVSGGGYINTDGVRSQEGDQLRAENLRTLRTFLDAGTEDIALENTLQWEDAIRAAGSPYRAHYYDGATHGDFGVLGWPELADYVADVPREVRPPQVMFRWQPGDERADLGMPVDRAYWVSELDERDPDARWSRIEATSAALDDTEYEPRVTEESLTIDGQAVEARELRLEPVGERETANAVSVDLQNVAHARIDLLTAGLDPDRPIAVRVTSDGAATLELDAGGRRTTVSVTAGSRTFVDLLD